MINRRNFVKKNALVLGGMMTAGSLAAKPMASAVAKHKFRLCLNPGAIGVSLGQRELFDAALKYGFKAISVQPKNLMEMTADERKQLVADMKENDITFGSTNLPIDFRKGQALFDEGFSTLADTCAIMQEVGATLMNTWILPSHNEYTYLQNFKLHSERLGLAANVAGYYGIRLGLEYVAPKTALVRNKFAFVRTMVDMKELIANINEDNVGFVLDAFHWYCANETKTDILTLDVKDIITVDLCDAREGFTWETQVDGRRELPLATGVIPIKGFIEGLAQIGYDGPVRAEPFNQPLRDMEDQAAIKKTYEMMTATMDLAG